MATLTKKSRRILVVDDHEDSAEVTAILLRSEGHEVVIAHCASDAIKHARVALPDVLLLDIGLPDMDGYALAGHLRALPAARQAVFIALTGFGRQQDIQRSKTAGFDHHLTKPIEPSELIALIASLH
jgi:CheY-like chemotaxis protein